LPSSPKSPSPAGWGEDMFSGKTVIRDKDEIKTDGMTLSNLNKKA
jgi:hypothetical protein